MQVAEFRQDERFGPVDVALHSGDVACDVLAEEPLGNGGGHGSVNLAGSV